jgi:RNA polymerase sigma factor for flagellar operon FliA
VAVSLGARLPRSIEMSDLTQAGFLGLLDAAEKFDENRGVRFRTYAELRIRGAILDSLRSLDWVPRSLRRLRRELQNMEDGLEARLGRVPSDEELAAAMNVSVPELRIARDRVRHSEIVSSGDESFERAIALTVDPQATSPQELLERREIELLLAREVEKLPPRERLVLTLYYQDELSMKEVGRVLGVNESRVSQIHSKAIVRLRLRLRNELRPRPLLGRSA